MADCGSINVQAAFDQSNVYVNDCSGLPSSATPGDIVAVDVQVVNDNPTSAEGTAAVRIGGQDNGTETFSVQSNSSTVVTVQITLPDETGEFTPQAFVSEGVTAQGSRLRSLFSRSSEDDTGIKRERTPPQ